MNKIITFTSIGLNLLLLYLLLMLSNRMGYLGRLFVAVHANALDLPTDTLSSQAWWQDEVKYQLDITRGQQYNTCLFGDSISSGLGNNLGNNTFNFAIPGMSTISQIEQLKMLIPASVSCHQAIIAIGTNDADYRTMGQQFVKNLQRVISMVRQMQAKQIALIPAFYSTVAASHDPSMAGTIDDVKQINSLIDQVAATDKLPVYKAAIQPLFSGEALKENLTVDGVHLNADGKKIYRKALLEIISQQSD